MSSGAAVAWKKIKFLLAFRSCQERLLAQKSFAPDVRRAPCPAKMEMNAHMEITEKTMQMNDEIPQEVCPDEAGGGDDSAPRVIVVFAA